MRRRQFLKSAAAGTAGLGAQTAPASRPPNIVFVLADQWRAQTLPSSGDRDLNAPNLARLANEGVHFDRVYASYPVCTPSRASLITGRFPHACGMPRNNLLLPADQPSIAAQLRGAGYATGYIGKWHLDGEEKPGFVPPGPRRRGFDYWAAFNRGHDYYRSTYFRDESTPILAEGFEPDYQTSLAQDFIRRQKQNPFYLFLSWGPPHTPRRPPKDLYDPAQFRLRPNVPASYEAEARKGHAGYYGLCTALDTALGRLLKTLDEEQLTRNTIVVFTSEHGDMLGSHGLEYKNVAFEESARVPLLIRYPGALEPGARSDMLISNIDLMPTLLSLCGAQVPSEVQGRDLSALLRTGKGARPESIFAEGQMGGEGEWRMVVRGFDKLVVNRAGEITHLFNLGEDPYEQSNLVNSRAHRRAKDELLALLRDWQRRTQDGRTGSGLRTRG
ncbi:MAG: sulfatase [Bryobacterales bacterium]|nr:sulfatase [Bryobacterales bacterium]